MFGKEEIKQIVRTNKAEWFVQHIQQHLKEDKISGEVCCKICDKDIHAIAQEKWKALCDEHFRPKTVPIENFSTEKEEL